MFLSILGVTGYTLSLHSVSLSLSLSIAVRVPVGLAPLQIWSFPENISLEASREAVAGKSPNSKAGFHGNMICLMLPPLTTGRYIAYALHI